MIYVYEVAGNELPRKIRLFLANTAWSTRVRQGLASLGYTAELIDAGEDVIDNRDAGEHDAAQELISQVI